MKIKIGKIKIGIITLLIAGLMILTAGLVSAQTPNTVTGTVTDATTGKPIEDASVRVGGSDLLMSADTGESGAYTLEGVPTGENSFIASADGYDSETVGADVSGTEGISVNFTLQPSVKAEAETTELEGDDDGGKVAGDRKGYVGIFTSATGGATGSGIAGSFVVTTKKGDIEVQIPKEGLEAITKRPGQSPGIPEDGGQVAVLVEFVDQGGDELVQVARQVIVKPAPQRPVVGAVTKITTDENGVRTLTIMRPNGTTKEVRLGSKGKPPEVGDLVTAFQGRGDDDDDDGPPTIRGLVRAQDVRQRLEGFLEDLSNRAGEASDKVEERLADRLAKLADKLESHAAKHAEIMERVSLNDRLPPQAVAGILNGLDRARRGQEDARARATEARSKSGPSRGPGLQGDRGNSGRGNQGGRDNSGSSSQADRDNGNSGGRGNSGSSSQADRGSGNSGGRGNSGSSGGRDLDSSGSGSGGDGDSSGSGSGGDGDSSGSGSSGDGDSSGSGS